MNERRDPVLGEDSVKNRAPERTLAPMRRITPTAGLS